MKKLVLAAVAIAAMVSCDKNESFSDVSSDIEATFEASQIATKTLGNYWENNDQVGIYMYEAGETDNTYSLARENVLHTSDVSGNFVIGTGVTPIYYPQSDKVDFYAYYPYQAGITTTYTADITKQYTDGDSGTIFDQGAVDFLTASLSNQSKTVESVGFLFDHRLAMLTLVVTQKASVASLEDVVVSLDNMNTQATFSTLTGQMTASSGVTGSIKFLTIDSDSDASGNVTSLTVTAIVLPETLSSNAKVTFTFDGTTHSAVFPANTAFTAGYNHTYNISVGYDEVFFEGGSTIDSWNSTTISGIIDAEED